MWEVLLRWVEVRACVVMVFGMCCESVMARFETLVVVCWVILVIFRIGRYGACAVVASACF